MHDVAILRPDHYGYVNDSERGMPETQDITIAPCSRVLHKPVEANAGAGPQDPWRTCVQTTVGGLKTLVGMDWLL